MPGQTIPLILYAFALFYCFLQWQVARKRFAGKPDEKEWLNAFWGIAPFMTLGLAMNMSLFAVGPLYDEFGNPAGFTWEVFRRQMGVLLGAWGMFEIIREALDLPIAEGDPPLLAGFKAQWEMVKTLFIHNLWGALAFFIFLGFLSGPDITVLLVAEIGVLALVVRVCLWIETRRQAKQAKP
jgi:hypothetical protein